MAAGEVEGRWTLYQALDPAIVLLRARGALAPPSGVSLTLRDGTLVVEGPARPLAMPIESALVRICQGALANVALHADAHEAVVSLTHTDRRVHLDIVDDGHGFDVAIIDDTRARNFGLRTMRHRVEELNGRWHLESHPGHTAVSVSFAIDEGSGEE